MQAEYLIKGYVEKEEIYISTEDESNPQTMLEEIAHYVTGATDQSRDFQDYAFRMTTELCKLVM
jgi:hypothetical protein